MINKFLYPLTLVLLGCCFHAYAQPSMDQSIPADPAYRSGTLDNGIKYYIRQNEKPEDRAELRLVVKAGSNQEDDDQQGLAHFVEHMAFNGTAHFAKSELVDYLESIGTRFGPDLNAYTSFDETVYMLQVRTDSLELLQKGMLILEDWAHGISFEDEEIDKERGVVESERRSGLGAGQRMRNKWLPVIYGGSRYAERIPIGKADIVKNAPYSALRRFYRDWYRPDLMAVVAVGDIDVDWMEKAITDHFAKIAAVETPRSRQDYDIPRHRETKIAVVSDEEAPYTQLQVSYKHDATTVKSLGDYRESLVRSLFNQMLNDRLQELTKSAEPPFLFASSGYGGSFSPLVDEYRSFSVAAEGQSLKALKVLLIENERVRKHGFLASELERAKTDMLKAMERQVKEKDKTESEAFASELVYHYLEENPVPSVDQEMALHEELLPGIRLEEISSLAQKWITVENRSVLITGPRKEGVVMPTEAQILSLLEEVQKMDIPPYEDKVLDGPLLARELTPVEITAEQNVEAIGVTELTLANGIRVVLKPTDFKNDEIMMQSFSKGGNSLYPDTDYMNASTADAIVQESGVGQFNSIQLQKKLTGQRVRVSPYIGELYEGINGSCSPDDLETMLKLVYLYVAEPRKDADAFQSFLSKQKSFLANMMANPQMYFYSQSSKIKYGDQIRRSFPPTVEDLESIDLARAMEIYRDRFLDTDDYVFMFVGNFEVEAMKPLLAKYLGNLPATDREETWKDLGIRMKTGKIAEEFARGEAPRTQVELTWHGDYDDWEASDRLAYAMMTSVLSIKLREAMREDEGGVYGVRVSGSPSKIPVSRQSIVISFNSEPDNTENLVEVAMAEINKLIEQGPEDKDMQKVKETRIQGRIKSLKENRWWMQLLNRAYREAEHTYEYVDIEPYRNLVQSIDAKAVQQMATKYLGGENFIKIVMTPEAESGKN